MKPASQHRIRCTTHQTVQIRAVETNEPAPGTCGSIAFIGLRYMVPDSYGTMFKPGCLAKTASAKVSKGIVKYFGDHIYRWRTHLGVIRSVEDVGDGVLVKADVLDAKEGREYLEYAKACMASGTQTGASIGFWDRASDVEEVNGQRYLVYSEIELEEFSGTPMNAVDGADLLSARRQGDTKRRETLLVALDGILSGLPEADARAAVEARYAAPVVVVPAVPVPVAEPAALVRAAVEPENQPASAIPVPATSAERQSALRRVYAPL